MLICCSLALSILTPNINGTYCVAVSTAYMELDGYRCAHKNRANTNIK